MPARGKGRALQTGAVPGARNFDNSALAQHRSDGCSIAGMSRAVFVAAIVATSLATPAAQQPRSVFRAATDLVWFGVTVTDKRGNVVNGLTKEDFEVVEENQKQVVSQFASGAEVSDLDLHAGVMFDTSESMTDDIDVSRTAAIKFLNRLPDAKDLTLVDFDTEVRIGRFSQDDFPRLVERIRTRKSEGWTALYDAFGIYLAGPAENAGRTVLVAFTDGGDSRSKIDFSDVVNMVRASSATIYAVGFLQNQSPSTRGEQRTPVVAHRGRVRRPGRVPLLHEANRRGLRPHRSEIRGQYNLGYVSTNLPATAVGAGSRFGCTDGSRRTSRVRAAGRGIRTGRSGRRGEAKKGDIGTVRSPMVRFRFLRGAIVPCQSLTDRFTLVTDFQIKGDQVRAIPSSSTG